MPDPQIERDRAEAARLAAQAKTIERHAEHADGPAYYRDRERANEARQRANALFASVAGAEKARKRQLARLHMAKGELGLDDDTWRALITRLSAGRTATSADLSGPERAALLDELKRSGWRPRYPGAPKPSGRDDSVARLVAKVGALLADQHLPWGYAEAILRRQRGILDPHVACPIDRANAEELRAVTAALGRRAARQST